ncbi:DUF6349 family protein [Piscicoccus intestinalis]|uniref:DUF6349 family protein n=1 Tax=Piscicoccus intestinalis TaxID=746033 RepID=UPI000839681D|nr:DUF6349 family protein [Piscicoccus intestinalis]
MAAAPVQKQYKKLVKRLNKRFEGTPRVELPGKDEKKKAKKADVEVLTYVEIGSFRHGACPDCGWQGPGRRAREKASRDYLDHAKECAKR